jgi:hypothetical protein
MERQKLLEAMEIDKLNLDREWVDHPQFYAAALLRHAEAREALDEAKRTLEEAEAKLATRIRKDPDRFGIEKLTEAALKQIVEADSSMKVLRTDVLEAKSSVDYCQVVCTAMAEKSNALKHLTQLYAAQYFSLAPAPIDRDSVKRYRKESGRKDRE